MRQPKPNRGNRANVYLFAILRIAVCVLALLLQLGIVFAVTWLLHEKSSWAYTILELMGIGTVIYVLKRDQPMSYKIPWMILVLLMPVFGFILYQLWGNNFRKNRRNKPLFDAYQASFERMDQDKEAWQRYADAYPEEVRLPTLLSRFHFPVYDHTACKYYPLGEIQFDDMLADLEKAEKFIFLSYFIVGENQVWARFHDVLCRKAAQGIEVRLLYDDFGSLFTLKNNFVARMQADGIQTMVFNPVQRYLATLYFNYRNHQKICVIDGNIGYTGGTNLDDEYANLYPKYGHWKDTAVRLKGDGVWSLTLFFLQMWDSAAEKLTEDYDRYRPSIRAVSDGFVLPLADGPANNPGNPGENTYKELIARAKESIYMTTPYLVLEEGMVDILCRTAESGVDVRIVTPGQYDHWYVYPVTRSYYKKLMQSGVRIYEYTPGFMHAKMVVCDNVQALVGTFNLDYRSFYLHFENAVLFTGSSVVEDVAKDMHHIFSVSRENTMHEVDSRPLYYKVIMYVFSLFAPMM